MMNRSDEFAKLKKKKSLEKRPPSDRDSHGAGLELSFASLRASYYCYGLQENAVLILEIKPKW